MSIDNYKRLLVLINIRISIKARILTVLKVSRAHLKQRIYSGYIKYVIS